jgi:hypothetical protein
VPQNAQKASELSTAWPHPGQVASPAPAGSAAWFTRVAGTEPPRPGAWMAMADADSGLPQSMQNREPSSLRRPQWAHVVTSVESLR